MSLTLILSGGVELKTTQQLLSCCNTVRNMLEGVGVMDELSVSFSNISLETMRRVITYAENTPPSSNEEKGDGIRNLTDFERSLFSGLDIDRLVDITNAANFLDYQELLVSCQLGIIDCFTTHRLSGLEKKDLFRVNGKGQLDEYIREQLKKDADFLRLNGPLLDNEDMDEYIREVKWYLEQ